jgi:hypothetical protein
VEDIFTLRLKIARKECKRLKNTELLCDNFPYGPLDTLQILTHGIVKASHQINDNTLTESTASVIEDDQFSKVKFDKHHCHSSITPYHVSIPGVGFFCPFCNEDDDDIIKMMNANDLSDHIQYSHPNQFITEKLLKFYPFEQCIYCSLFFKQKKKKFCQKCDDYNPFTDNNEMIDVSSEVLLDDFCIYKNRMTSDDNMISCMSLKSHNCGIASGVVPTNSRTDHIDICFDDWFVKDNHLFLMKMIRDQKLIYKCLNPSPKYSHIHQSNIILFTIVDVLFQRIEEFLNVNKESQTIKDDFNEFMSTTLITMRDFKILREQLTLVQQYFMQRFPNQINIMKQLIRFFKTFGGVLSETTNPKLSERVEIRYFNSQDPSYILSEKTSSSIDDDFDKKRVQFFEKKRKFV